MCFQSCVDLDVKGESVVIRRDSSPDSDSGDEPPLKKQRPKLIDSKKPKAATDNGQEHWWCLSVIVLFGINDT